MYKHWDSEAHTTVSIDQTGFRSAHKNQPIVPATKSMTPSLKCEEVADPVPVCAEDEWPLVVCSQWPWLMGRNTTTWNLWMMWHIKKDTAKLSNDHIQIKSPKCNAKCEIWGNNQPATSSQCLLIARKLYFMPNFDIARISQTVHRWAQNSPRNFYDRRG